MKQLLQSLKNGETQLVESPIPEVSSRNVLIQVKRGIVSAGTERMLVDFGKSNYIQKARQQPEKVKQVLDKIKTDGLQPTIQAVRTKLDQPIPLGYSNAGIVIAVGKDVKNFKIGDKVISNGAHAEVVSVSENLCTKIPENVHFDEAAFTVITSIGLQGIRLIKPTLGETVVVTGLGLIGLLTVQLLKAHGCKVIASDFDQQKVELAKSFGADAVNVGAGIDIVEYVNMKTKGRGADAVLITASTTSSEPVSQAARMSRQRGRIILVGVTGLELNRSEFYEKELTFQVSCSYGPGRYDPNYEEKGQDYPIGFVRWTEQRNFEAILDMMSEGKLNVEEIITHEYDFEDAVSAYSTLSEDRTAIGILLKYPERDISIDDGQTVPLMSNDIHAVTDQSVIGIIGAGNYTNQTLLPAMNALDVYKKTIVSSGGMTSVHVGKRFNFLKASTDTNDVFNDLEINSIIITTRHNTHASLVKKALEAKKHVFVEKPLCLTRDELNEIKGIQHNQLMMVGFNRRFSPHTQQIKTLLGYTTQPKAMIMTVNAGAIPADHWTQDLDVGGGRIIGEACHFIDLLRYLIDSPISNVSAASLADPSEAELEDKVTINLSFLDGSIGTIHYFANGDKSFPKERLEVFVGGKILALDNFKTLMGYGWPNFKKFKTKSQDKGHALGIKAFFEGIKEGKAPIPINEIYEVTEATFDAVEQIRR
ncbi:bi-domain-containing oxidoreductase [Lederbergia citrea]|uniref:bi-domain-containing oxidoreductase n=1 Tax=Lederbergia citrea TaxID=2833581 RepID=UPI001BC94C4E|nr:bi-domain-containing oxidoreductase [Lederbergia citrea]MBS4204803.1 bi-domain-containing oxidoreductase [Lederbergia citrea]